MFTQRFHKPLVRTAALIALTLGLSLSLGACGQKSAEQNVKDGIAALDQNKPADAFKAFQAASKQGSAEANYYLALLYDGTIPGSPEKDVKKGESLLKQSADAAYVPAEGAYCLVTAMRVSIKEALSYCQKAEKEGNGLGLMTMGMIAKDQKQIESGLQQIKQDCEVKKDPLACFAAKGAHLIK